MKRTALTAISACLAMVAGCTDAQIALIDRIADRALPATAGASQPSGGSDARSAPSAPASDSAASASAVAARPSPIPTPKPGTYSGTGSKAIGPIALTAGTKFVNVAAKGGMVLAVLKSENGGITITLAEATKLVTIQFAGDYFLDVTAIPTIGLTVSWEVSITDPPAASPVP